MHTNVKRRSIGGSDESRAENCPIKSVDALTEKIDHLEKDDINAWCEEEIGYNKALVDVVELIQEYCEVKEWVTQ